MAGSCKPRNHQQNKKEVSVHTDDNRTKNARNKHQVRGQRGETRHKHGTTHTPSTCSSTSSPEAATTSLYSADDGTAGVMATFCSMRPPKDCQSLERLSPV